LKKKRYFWHTKESNNKKYKKRIQGTVSEMQKNKKNERDEGNVQQQAK